MARPDRPRTSDEQRQRGEALGSNLRKHRTERYPALSEAEFAAPAGVSVNTLRKIENSTPNPSFFVFDDLARALELDLNEPTRAARGIRS